MSKIFSDYKFYPIKNSKSGTLVANAQVTVLGTVVINFNMVNGKNGLFPSLPADRKEDKEKPGGYAYYQKVRFPDDSVYEEFQKLSVEEYKAFLAKSDQPSQKNTNANEHSQETDNYPPF